MDGIHLRAGNICGSPVGGLFRWDDIAADGSVSLGISGRIDE